MIRATNSRLCYAARLARSHSHSPIFTKVLKQNAQTTVPRSASRAHTEIEQEQREIARIAHTVAVKISCAARTRPEIEQR